MTETKEFDTTGLHDKPVLTSGSGGPAVFQLCNALAELGHETSVSKGENPYGIVDPSVLSAVQAFRGKHNVSEDAEAFGSEENAKAHIGPATWAALRDAVDAPATGPAAAPPTAARETVEPVQPKPKSSGSSRKKSSGSSRKKSSGSSRKKSSGK